MDPILQILFMKGTRNYRQICDKRTRSGSTKTVRKKLDVNIAEGLVEEHRENWRRGKPIFYSLSKKGEEQVLADMEGGFAGVLGKMKEYTDAILTNPERLAGLVEFLNSPLTLDHEWAFLTGSSDQNFEKTVQDVRKRRADRNSKRQGLLIEVLRNLHEIFLTSVRKNFPGEKEWFIGFPKNAYGNPVLKC